VTKFIKLCKHHNCMDRKKYMREYNREYYKRNKKKMVASSRKWQDKNKEKIIEYRKEYSSRPEVRKRNTEHCKKYYGAHKKERIDYIKKKMGEYRKNPLFRKREYLGRRRRQDENSSILLKKRKQNKNYYSKNKNKIKRKMGVWRINNPIKVNAQLIAYKKVNTKDKCEICGNKNRLYRHHPDYNKPLEVITLCSTCHYKQHRKIREL